MSEIPHQRLPRTCSVIQKGIDDRLHLGMQVCISRNFQPVADFAFGENSVDQSLRPEMLLPWLSAGKPVTAIAIMQRVERGELSLRTPVCEVIPEFAAAGKENITLWNLLTHTAALKPIATGWPKRSWKDIIEKICQTGLRRDRGYDSNAGYDPARSWFILGEILQRLDGRTIDRIVREDVLLPLGMRESWMAISADQFEEYRPRLGKTYQSRDGKLIPASGSLPENCTHPSPGGSMRGPIRELVRLYEMLLRHGEAPGGQRLLRPETIGLMTSRQREGEFDATFRHTIDFGLGLIINSNRYGAETVPYGFGRYASEESFGHGGAQSSIGFADPEHCLVVAAVANGLPSDDLHNQRFREFNSAIYEDLGLAGERSVQ